MSLTPLSPALGNVTAVFAALSYAGTLRLAVRTDKTLWPDADLLILGLLGYLGVASWSSRTSFRLLGACCTALLGVLLILLKTLIH